MAKKKSKGDPISKKDIECYLNKYSDFSFEIEVLRKFISNKFSCQHAGTYEDPITKKTRQFDIRASKQIISNKDLHLYFCFAVECKNVGDNFPLVVHCVPREDKECYLDLIWSFQKNRPRSPRSRRIRTVEYPCGCPYRKSHSVGKSLDQVGVDTEGNPFGNDADVFDKMSQSINSSYDLIKQGHYASFNEKEVVTIVVPVLVVPDDRLWTVIYKNTGEILQEPMLTKNIEYFIGKEWKVGANENEKEVTYYLSHMEIVQIGSIKEMLDKYLNNLGRLTEDDLKQLYHYSLQSVVRK